MWAKVFRDTPKKITDFSISHILVNTKRWAYMKFRKNKKRINPRYFLNEQDLDNQPDLELGSDPSQDIEHWKKPVVMKRGSPDDEIVQTYPNRPAYDRFKKFQDIVEPMKDNEALPGGGTWESDIDKDYSKEDDKVTDKYRSTSGLAWNPSDHGKEMTDVNREKRIQALKSAGFNPDEKGTYRGGTYKYSRTRRPSTSLPEAADNSDPDIYEDPRDRVLDRIQDPSKAWQAKMSTSQTQKQGDIETGRRTYMSRKADPKFDTTQDQGALRMRGSTKHDTHSDTKNGEEEIESRDSSRHEIATAGAEKDLELVPWKGSVRTWDDKKEKETEFVQPAGTRYGQLDPTRTVSESQLKEIIKKVIAVARHSQE